MTKSSSIPYGTLDKILITRQLNNFTKANTVNIVHKLVTVFAGHLDSFIVINNQLKRLETTATSGSGKISVQMTLIQFAGICKNCAPESLRSRDTAYLVCTGTTSRASR